MFDRALLKVIENLIAGDAALTGDTQGLLEIRTSKLLTPQEAIFPSR